MHAEGDEMARADAASARAGFGDGSHHASNDISLLYRQQTVSAGEFDSFTVLPSCPPEIYSRILLPSRPCHATHVEFQMPPVYISLLI